MTCEFRSSTGTLSAFLVALLSTMTPLAAAKLPKLPRRPAAVLVTGATLIDGTGAPAVAGSWIFVRDGKIVDVSTVAARRGRGALPRDVEVVDGSGKWIVPGFVDAHVHVESLADTKAMIRWGVTSARLMAEGVRSSRRMAARSRSRLHTPELFPAAPIFTTAGGWWSTEPPDPDLDRFPADPAAARAAVDRAKALGAAEIKIMDDDMGWCRDPLPRLPKIAPAIRSALIAQARRDGLRVAVHAPELSDAADAVADGATVLAHGIVDAAVTDDLVRRMRDGKVFYVPTLDIFDLLADPRGFMARALSDPRIRESLPKKTLALYRSDAYFETYRTRYPNAAYVGRQIATLDANARKLKASGIDVAAGTDMWAFPGAGMHLELEDLVRAGWTPLEAIRAATRVSARSLGADADRGTIEPGKRADFVILENDPLHDIRNTRSIETVYKGGRVAWSRYRREGEE